MIDIHKVYSPVLHKMCVDCSEPHINIEPLLGLDKGYVVGQKISIGEMLRGNPSGSKGEILDIQGPITTIPIFPGIEFAHAIVRFNKNDIFEWCFGEVQP